jgi:hypothetical protein
MMTAAHVGLLAIGYPVALAWGVGWKVLFPAIEAALFAGLVWRIDPATLRRVLLWWVWAMAVLAGLLSWYQAITDRSMAALIGLAVVGGVALLRYVWGVHWPARRTAPTRAWPPLTFPGSPHDMTPGVSRVRKRCLSWCLLNNCSP